MKALSILAVIATLASGVFLYIASRPISGSITFVGGRKTEADIARHERWRRVGVWLGLAVLVASAVLQFLVIWRT